MNKSILFKALEGFGLLWKSISLLLLTSVVLANTTHAEVDFDYLHGSDLGMGIGARAVSMGGAFTAVAASGDLKEDIPWPGIAASLGLGLVLKRFDIDLALHGNPARTYVEQSPHLGATGTLIFKF